MRERCWQLLREDPDEDVRAMAAACLGSQYFGTKSRQVFRRLVQELKQPEQPLETIYRALFKLAGAPPSQWPAHLPLGRIFQESDIDWAKIAWLEDQMVNP
ncbi:MAG: hypothetical protein WAM82_24770 [Thermoanaerobaculia bacterium]